ncbi:hypothetical protein MTO96_019432 [Rhipicephalus appendiculatus]
MPSKAPKLMATLGIVGLVHAAISAAQHRSYLRLTEQDFTVLPLDIIFQSVLCLLITMYGTMCIAGDFKGGPRHGRTREQDLRDVRKPAVLLHVLPPRSSAG